MIAIESTVDPELCARLWQTYWPIERFFDLWPVRDSFAQVYQRPCRFLTAVEGGTVRGLLALSWIEEHERYSHFPGEIWHGKTWLEQNKIVTDDAQIAGLLLEALPAPAHVRYLIQGPASANGHSLELDETGYLFFPPHYGYSYDAYLGEFSGKGRKRIFRELDALTATGVTVRTDDRTDIDLLFRLNLEAFGEHSYFRDPRFLAAFERLIAWMSEQGLLRIVTVLIGGTVAAIDIGAVWNETYTVLAGGTNPEFQGVAKFINLHHIEWACRAHMREVDFLCGDFGWKERFHLQPRPLYHIHKQTESVSAGLSADVRSVFCAV